MLRKIVITGPESSGKTTLGKLLAKEYGCCFVKEYAREYLEKLDRPYELNDVLLMAKEQFKQEEVLTSGLIFLDTDLTVFAIWIKDKYDQEIGWINEGIKNSKKKIYLLCDIDIEWEEDKLREHPNEKDRQRLFNDYKQFLEKHQLSYHIISGDIPTRIMKCKEIISKC